MPTPTQQLIQDDCKDLQVDVELHWAVEDVPSMLELESACRAAPRRKAIGLDGIPGEFLAAAAPEVARSLFALTAKAALVLKQPLQWRGGILQEAWKRTGARDSACSYRSLFVSSVVGKGFHRLLRARTHPTNNTALHDFHLGARPKAPVLLPAMYVQNFLRWQKQRGHSAAVVFLDSQSAYYRVIRELAVGSIEGDEAIAKVFKHFGLEPSDMHEFYENITNGGMMGEAGMSPVLRHLAKDTMYRSWFVTRHGNSEQVCATGAGSRPGESWADLVYAYVLGRILTVLHEIATAEDLLTPLTVDVGSGVYGDGKGEEDFFAPDCTWADDCAFPLSDPCPHRLLNKTARMSALIIEFCRRHGMIPNLRPKKTAVVMALRGKGAQQARRRWFPDGARAIHLAELDLHLPVAPDYVHLGGVIDPEVKLVQEVRRRMGQARAAYDSGRKLLYGNASIPLRVRASLFRMSVTATFYNLGMWVPMGAAWDSFEDGFTRLLRNLLAPQLKGDDLYKCAAPAVHLLTGTAPLASFARQARLSLLQSMCRAGPRALWAVLQQDATWLQQARQDLLWLVNGQAGWPVLGQAGWAEWHHLFTSRTGWIKGRIAKRLREDFATFRAEQTTTLALWALWRRARGTSNRDLPNEQVWACTMCQRVLKTKAALGAHFFKTHGRRATYRSVAHGTLCEACGRQFWSRTRLACHLRASPHCVAVLRTRTPQDQAPAPGLGSRGWRQAKAEDFTFALPEQQQAPLDVETEKRWDTEVKQAYDALCDRLTEYGLPQEAPDLLSLILDTLQGYPLYYQDVKDILDVIEAEILQLLAAGLGAYWKGPIQQALLTAIRGVTEEAWTAKTTAAAPPAKQETLKAFAARVDGLEWSGLLRRSRTNETRKVASITLGKSWEVALDCTSETTGLATVRSGFWNLVPAELQKGWDLLLEGAELRIVAPESFWKHRLARPFLLCRVPNAS